MVDLFEKARSLRIVPEFELFDLGQVASLGRLLDRCGLPFGGRVHVDFVMGVPGGMPGTAQALVAAVAALPEQVTSWSATGIGRTHLPVAAATLALGGHLRVGMEDNLVYARGRVVASNAELVERAARLAAELQRPAMSTVDARELLAVPVLGDTR
jgi:3-keto-5-aminohexanoate cleavage enzyme